MPFKPHKGKLPSFSGVDLTPLTDDSVLHKADRQQQESSRENTDTNGLAMLSSSTSIVKVLCTLQMCKKTLRLVEDSKIAEICKQMQIWPALSFLSPVSDEHSILLCCNLKINK